MNKVTIASSVLIGILLMGFGFAYAQDQDQQDVDVDQVIAKCEEQNTAESNPDENERNRLIDECIEKQLNAGKPQPEEG